MNGLLVIQYNLGDGEQRIVEARGGPLHDGQYHYVTIIRRENVLSMQLDEFEARRRSHGL